jgi:hypothetical protein
VGHEHGPDRGEHDHARGHLRARAHRKLPGLVSSLVALVVHGWSTSGAAVIEFIEWRRCVGVAVARQSVKVS